MSITASELKKAVVHLAFDVEHFLCYQQLHKNLKLQRLCPAASQAVTYSLLLHLRLLLDFFYGPPKKDDCWVGHFAVLPNFSRVFPVEISKSSRDETREVSVQLHKRLAHLTATRWREPAPPMEYYDQYFGKVVQLIDLFTRALPADLHATFLRERRRWATNHPPKI